MKGDVKRKYSPQTGRPDFILSPSSPCEFSTSLVRAFFLAVSKSTDGHGVERGCEVRDLILRL
jgi:hypothetical protein